MLVQLAEYYHARNMQNWPRVKRVNDYILGNKWWGNAAPIEEI